MPGKSSSRGARHLLASRLVSSAFTSAEFKRFNSAILCLHAAERPEEFPVCLLTALRTLIPADICSVNLIGYFGSPFVHVIDPPGAIPAPVEEALFRTLHENVSYGRRTTATRISDTISRDDWQRTAHYAEGFRQIGQEDGLGIDLALDDGCRITLNASRSSFSFLDAEALALDLLRPHLVSAYRRLAVTHPVGGERGAWALLDSDTLRLCEPLAHGTRLLLENWFGPELLSGNVRSQLKTRLGNPQPGETLLALQWSRGDRILKMRVSPATRQGGNHFLIVEEKFAVTLSPRQQEILIWVAQGLTNAQIAARLDIGASTVKRHLEELYLRLNARNRIEAVAAGKRRGLLPNG